MPLSTGNEQILVASKLMQYYRVFTPLSAGSMIQAVTDSSGQVELISKGNDGDLYNIWPNPYSDTGWSMTPLNALAINQGAVTSFSALQTAGGGITVMATFADASNTTYSLSDELVSGVATGDFACESQGQDRN